MLKLVHQIIIIFKSLNMYAVESFNLGKGTVERNKKSKTTIIFDSKNKKNKKKNQNFVVQWQRAIFLFYSMLYSPMSACKPLTTNCIIGTFLGEQKQAVAVVLLPRLGLFLKKIKHTGLIGLLAY